MVSDEVKKFISGMGAIQQNRVGREMLEMKAKGFPEEVIDETYKKRFKIEQNVKVEADKDLKNTLGEILSEVKEQKKEMRNMKDSMNNIQVWQTDLPKIGPADLGIDVKQIVDLGKEKITSKIVTKEESHKDDIGDIVSLLKQAKGDKSG